MKRIAAFAIGIKRGFTLVELLVVIAIIGLLISILLPSLAKARAQARQLECASILRQWGQAYFIYAAQNDGVIPHGGDRTRNPFAYLNAYFPLFPQNESSYLYVLPPLMSRKSWADFPLGEKPTADIWQCPLAEIGPDYLYGYQPSIHGYRSFAANTYLDFDRPLAMPPGVAPYPSFLNLAKARSPSVTILLFETTLKPEAGYGQAPPGSIVCMAGLYPNENPRSFGDRHPHVKGKLGGNVMMLDGHLEWRDHLWNPELSNPEMPPVTDREWWPY
jgi:prepilin-type N-terminal cleavage/methylation domain-containing protein